MAVGIRGGSLTTSSTSTLLNNGTGTFAAAANIAGNGSYDTEMSVASADFNGDGYPDLATVNSMNDALSVRLNNGSGGFGSPTNYATDLFPFCVVAGDFNGDGHTDLAVLCYNCGSTIVSVYMNNGNGTFASKVDYNVIGGRGLLNVRPPPLRRRLPRPDHGACDSNDVAVLKNNENGTFAAPVYYSTGSGSEPFSVTAAEVSGGARPTSLPPTTAQHSWRAEKQRQRQIRQPHDLRRGKQNRTRSLRLTSMATARSIWQWPTTIATRSACCETRRPAVLSASPPGRHFAVGRFPKSVTAADLTGDGKIDLAVANFDSQALSAS